MSAPRPLLMIPGPIEISPAVRAACAGPPPGHLAPVVLEAFGASLERMREVWLAPPSAQPFVVAGGGTLAMDMAAANLLEPGERALLVNTGFFSDRLAEMLRRSGSEVLEVRAPVGHAPTPEAVAEKLDASGAGVKALFATHVDTSTGVRLDPRPLAELARERGMLSIFDGVCATAGERFDMAGWGADVYLTASQKAIGLPAGLALLVASEGALEARRERRAAAPPMYLDWLEWLPVMRAYEERRPAYFSTPATNLILGLDTGLREILAEGMERRFRLHERAAGAMRAAWEVMGLESLPADESLAANTLSALKLPEGIDPSIVTAILERGVAVAGGLLPEIRLTYFRVGHMGFATTRPEMLRRTVTAIAGALVERGVRFDPRAALAAANAVFDEASVS